MRSCGALKSMMPTPTQVSFDGVAAGGAPIIGLQLSDGGFMAFGYVFSAIEYDLSDTGKIFSALFG